MALNSDFKSWKTLALKLSNALQRKDQKGTHEALVLIQQKRMKDDGRMIEYRPNTDSE